MSIAQHKQQGLAYVVIVTCVAFAAWYLHYLVATLDQVTLGPAAWVVFALKTGVELVASFYGIAFLLSSVAYLLMREDQLDVLDHNDRDTQVGLVYLCCDDLDASALESLLRLSYSGPLVVVIQDDSRSAVERAKVDELTARLRGARSWDVHLLRRPDKSGGKAAAVNYVLDRTGDLYDVFLLCDNDSTALAADPPGGG